MKTGTVRHGRNVYIVDGNRSPFLKARGKPGPFTAADLAVNTGKNLLSRQSFAPTQIDEAITGCVMPSPDEANISRIVALRLGCGKKIPAWTVQRNCGSGLQSIDNAAFSIASGRYDLVLAGGVEAMSHSPILFNDYMVNWLAEWNLAKTYKDKFLVLAKLKPQHFAPIIALLRGLTDPVVGLNMGQTAENLAHRFQISREQMDEFALMSHQRLARAQDEGVLKEVTPIYDNQGQFYALDDGVRRDTSLEVLAKLKPVYDKKYGKVTAGNSSQVTDGAAFLMLASAEAIKHYHLPVVAKIVDVEWAGLDPAEMGLGPAYAIPPLLARNKLMLADIDYWEINEAFAAQVLACIKVLEDADYSRTYLGLEKPLGKIDLNRLNIHGGAIALGHPIGASGARLVIQLMNILKQQNAKLGIAALCIGGGQGGAMLIERTETIDRGDK